MFKPTKPTQYIASKSIAIKPDVVSDVGPNDQIRISIPSFVNFIDPNQTYLKFNMTHNNAKGQLVPDPVCGAHAIFRDVMYRDGNNQATLEYNEDYNANMALLNHYKETPSISNKNQLFSGKQPSNGDNEDQKTLFYDAKTPLTAGTLADPDTTTRTASTPTIMLPLNSSLFKQGNIIPVGLMNGLKIVLNTDDLLRSHRYLSFAGEESTNGFVSVTDKALDGDKRNGPGAAQAMAMEITCPIANNPFSVGDRLYISNPDVAKTNSEVLGDIYGFYTVGPNVKIAYLPDRPTAGGLQYAHAVGSYVYYKVADREQGRPVYLPADWNGDVKSGVTLAPSYTLSNIELICQSVQPPLAYVEGMMKASQSEKGVSMDIMNYELYRHNQSNKIGLTQIQIPTLMKRARSLFCQPLPTSSVLARSFSNSSLTGIVDHAKSYEWVHGTQHYPSRLVPLGRYSQVVAGGSENRNEALHTNELQKAIINIDEPVLNLQQIAKHFVIARGLTKYAQVMDLSNDTLSLRIDYEATAEHDKIFNNYVYGMRRINISKSGVTVM